MYKVFSFFLLLMFFQAVAWGQKDSCSFSLLGYDEFDSTFSVVTTPLNIGYLIPSEFKLPNGEPKMVEEAKCVGLFAQNDSIDALFLTIAALERSFLKSESGFHVSFKLDSVGEYFSFYDTADQGTFDPKSNMRIYLHTVTIPLEIYYILTYKKVEKIRIEYLDAKRTITLLPFQQDELQNLFRCLGKGAGLYPRTP